MSVPDGVALTFGGSRLHSVTSLLDVSKDIRNAASISSFFCLGWPCLASSLIVIYYCFLLMPIVFLSKHFFPSAICLTALCRLGAYLGTMTIIIR